MPVHRRHVLALMLAFAATSAAPTLARKDRDCLDFKTQRKAQRFFKKHQPRKDPHGLDADGDGKACEELD